MKLYNNPISTCSQKVRLCLAEKELSFEEHRIDFTTQDHLSDWYLELNPNGVVPTLVHDGQAVIDSSVICEYLCETFPDQGERLSPESSFGRAQMRAWMRYIEEVPTVAIRFPSFNTLFKDFLGQMDGDSFEQLTEKMPLRKAFYKQFGKQGFSEQEIETSLEKLNQTLGRIEQATQNSEFILGSEPSLADITVLPSIVRMEDIGLSSMWQSKPAVTRWYERMTTRPSFAMAYYSGSRVNTNEPAL